ncbi:unnamed protein product [Rhodiola kirilowii]
MDGPIHGGTNHGALELENPRDGNRFKVNGQRVKHYQGEIEAPTQEFDLAEPLNEMGSG